jgi:hypothetical protein
MTNIPIQPSANEVNARLGVGKPRVIPKNWDDVKKQQTPVVETAALFPTAQEIYNIIGPGAGVPQPAAQLIARCFAALEERINILEMRLNSIGR